ncbi:hypothetical protein F5X68DRAFT_262171 [Plectosphaerella plurivora]|uniref:Glycan binding protein Y3-like domain-containing protein n=1 Tax=Plectosphaerella plurivora TaxID=936078 RepID=A0A9P8VC42_9PEZI|nr:hypothetical protein F5X68DRAFT_262171 [Plectosphaerella plurivora]
MHPFKLFTLLFAALVAASYSLPRSSSDLQLDSPATSPRDLSSPNEDEDFLDEYFADSPDEDPEELLDNDSSTNSTLIPTLSKRSCYFGGVGWGSNRNQALDFVDKACRNVFVGNYRGKTERNACYQLTWVKKVNFTVRRWHSSSRNLDFEYCKKNLRLEIKGCSTGGQSYRGNWRFRSDPNAGRC